MNDPGLEDVIEETENDVHRQLRNSKSKSTIGRSNGKLPGIGQRKSKADSQDRKSDPSIMVSSRGRKVKGENRGARTSNNPEGDDSNPLYQATVWWFASTAFPLFAASFGPIANLFSVCALVSPWRIRSDDGSTVPDPPWLLAMNACSLALALLANIILLFNFARRIRYSVAQPFTITLWYLSAILLVIPLGLSHNHSLYVDPSTQSVYSESYYYGLISAVLYFSISSLLLSSTLGATLFHKYPASFASLTGPQRTLMLQTTSFALYLAIGGGIFSAIEGWRFTDGIYWADYTLLTIGLGTDFPLYTTLGRMLLIPYAAFGITMIGLIVSSVRQLVLERAKSKVVRRFLAKKREQWEENMKNHQQHSHHNSESDSRRHRLRSWNPLRNSKREEKRLLRQVHQHVAKKPNGENHRPGWHRFEFELMRFIESGAEKTERHMALGSSFLVIMLVWTMGALIFWLCEHDSQDWKYIDAFYFTYTSLLTIGYGDLYPSSSSGRPFFVFWSLISVPAMTVLISNMGDTVIQGIKDVTMWASRWTILPERGVEGQNKGLTLKKMSTRELDEAGEKGERQGRDGDEEDEEDQRTQANNDGNADVLQHDLERLGSDVEHFEEDEGRPDSLSAQIAKEISSLAKDMSAKPPKKYTWDEWEKWMKMLGKIQDTNSDAKDTKDGMRRVSTEGSATRVEGSEGDEWKWTWLGDDGPLFSRLTETEWIMEHLCFRLEEVLEDEIKAARGEKDE